MEDTKILEKLNEISAALRFQIGTRGVKWLEDVPLKAENFAVSYDYMYVMVQVLKHMGPRSMIEFGLGESSKILISYANSSYRPGGKCVIVEHNSEWIRFFKRAFDCKEELGRVNFYRIPMYTNVDEEFGTPLNYYENIEPVVRGEKYDFISIDGPFGSPRNSRMDLLPYIPECLAPSWCIMLDDYGRQGEHDMIETLKKILESCGIKYRGREYGEGSEKQFYLLTSEENRFLTTLL